MVRKLLVSCLTVVGAIELEEKRVVLMPLTSLYFFVLGHKMLVEDGDGQKGGDPSFYNCFSLGCFAN